MKNTFSLICALLLSGCVGSKVQSYRTETQKFNWGHMHAWMSKNVGSKHDDTEGTGYLLLNLSFKKKLLNKSCMLTINRVSLEDPNTGTHVLNEKPVFSNSKPMQAEIEKYTTRQISLRQYPFEYVQSAFPYDLSLDMVFDCEGKKTTQTFSKPVEFRMVQPVIWEQ